MEGKLRVDREGNIGNVGKIHEIVMTIKEREKKDGKKREVTRIKKNKR